MYILAWQAEIALSALIFICI